MPVRRVPATSDQLTEKVAQLEKAGETIIQVIPWANDFLIITRVDARKPAARRETRTSKPTAKSR
jgi:hypothetical protein